MTNRHIPARGAVTRLKCLKSIEHSAGPSLNAQEKIDLLSHYYLISCSGLNCDLQKRNGSVGGKVWSSLNSTALECKVFFARYSLLWREGLYRGDRVKMMSLIGALTEREDLDPDACTEGRGCGDL